jgi:molybdopterin-guanine dinucleotide biosynthesis protein B
MASYNEFKVPVLGFAAYSGTGKTTLLVKLLPLMKLQGLRVATIKQTHHDFEIDKPGKDSYECSMSG